MSATWPALPVLANALKEHRCYIQYHLALEAVNDWSKYLHLKPPAKSSSVEAQFALSQWKDRLDELAQVCHVLVYLCYSVLLSMVMAHRKPYPSSEACCCIQMDGSSTNQPRFDRDSCLFCYLPIRAFSRVARAPACMTVKKGPRCYSVFDSCICQSFACCCIACILTRNSMLRLDKF